MIFYRISSPMPKPRINLRLSHKAYALLDEMTRAPGAQKSAILEAAFWAYVDPEKHGEGEAALRRQMDQMALRLNAIERDTTLCVETLGQFVLYWLTRSDPLPDGQRDAAHRLGQRRFDYFIEQVARKVAVDDGLSAKVFERRDGDSVADSLNTPDRDS